jgi:RNA polymerase sigma-70 factor, ECF subfamily
MPLGPEREWSGRGPGGSGRAELVARLRSGDAEALRLVRDRVRRILRFRGLWIPEDELADLEQEVMTQVWRAVNRTGFDPEAGIWGFVEVVTARRCIDWLRSRRASEPLEETWPDTRRDPLRSTLGRESRRLAAETLAALDEPCRELISLRIQQDLGFAEIARRLGRSEGALRVQMYRCVRSARRALELLAGGPKR